MKFSLEVLGKQHNRKGFSCDISALDIYFHEQVTQDTKRRITTCFVAVNKNNEIAGFYTIASASIPITDLPTDITKRLPRYPVLPAIRIGRLAVDSKFQKQGVGGILLIDAIRRSLQVDVASYTMLVDAKNETAIAFYKHHGFIALSSSPKTLFLPLTTAEKIFL